MSSMFSGYKTAFRSFNGNVRSILTYFTLASVANGVISVLLNLYFLKLGMDENWLGSTVLIQSLCLALMVLPLGMLADRKPREKLIKVAYLLLGCSYTGFVLSRQPATLLGFFALQGLGSALTVGSEIPYLAENTPMESRAHLFSLTTAMNTAGSALGMAVGGYLPKMFGMLLGMGAESAESYRASLICGVTLFWAASFAVLALKRSPAGSPGNVPQSKRLSLRLSKPGVVVGLGLNHLFVALAASMFVPFANVIMKQRYAMPSYTIGLVLTAQNIVISLGSLMIPRLSERYGHLAGAAILQVMTLPAYLTLGLAPNSTVFSVAFVIRGLMANMPYPLIDTYTMESVSTCERGTVNALVNLMRNLVWALGGKIGGMLLRQRSYSLPILMACCSYCLAAGVLVVMVRKRHLRYPMGQSRMQDLP